MAGREPVALILEVEAPSLGDPRHCVGALGGLQQRGPLPSTDAHRVEPAPVGRRQLRAECAVEIVAATGPVRAVDLNLGDVPERGGGRQRYIAQREHHHRPLPREQPSALGGQYPDCSRLPAQQIPGGQDAG